MKKVHIKIPRQLNLAIRKALTAGHYKGHDPEELFYMQEFPKLRQTKIGYSHSNVAVFCKNKNYDLAYGYKVWRYKNEKQWKKEPYSFALDSGKVLDLDNNVDWNEIDVHFIGVIVEPILYTNLSYIKNANLDFYKRRSAFSLFTKDYLEKDTKK